MNLKSILCVLAVAASGCRSDSNSDTIDGPTSGMADAPISTGMTIAALYASSPKFPQAVEVDGVVVVAKKPPSATVIEIWVQDPNGGLNSGIHIYCNTGASKNACPMKVSDVDALKIGDVIDVKGIFDNNNFSGHPDDFEIIAPMITPEGKTKTPAPLVITATDLAKLGKDQYASADFDKYANTLVKIMGPITVKDLMAAEYGTTSCSVAGAPDAGPAADAGPKPDAGPSHYLFGFEATAGSTTIAIGLRYLATFKSCMPDCDVCTAANQCSQCGATRIQPGDTFQYVQGIVYGNSQVSMQFLEIQPVNDADLPK
jgi:hypothetical protein